jgi:hypothetical protein
VEILPDLSNKIHCLFTLRIHHKILLQILFKDGALNLEATLESRIRENFPIQTQAKPPSGEAPQKAP